MWLDYWRGGGGTKDMLASPSKIIGRGLAPLFLHIFITVFLQVHEEGFSFKNSNKMDVYFWDYFKPENPIKYMRKGFPSKNSHKMDVFGGLF